MTPLPHPLGAALALALAALPAASRAEDAGACHCFQDRTWDPARPSAADAYILATTRSSLLSAAFGVPKRALVTSAMSGSSPEALWIEHWEGASPRNAERLRAARAELGARATPEALAALAIDDVLVSRVGAEPSTLAALRATGARSEEVVLAAVLAAHLGAPTAPLVREVRAGRTSWGAVLHGAGLEPKGLDALVRGLVRPAPPAAGP